MYISKIEIENFRNFRTNVVTFNNGLNVIIGENNAGKSNLLRALRLLLDPIYNKNLKINDFCKHIPWTSQAPPKISISIIIEGQTSIEAVEDMAVVSDWLIELDDDNWQAQLTYEFFLPEEYVSDYESLSIQEQDTTPNRFLKLSNILPKYVYRIYRGKPDLKQKASYESLSRLGFYFLDAIRDAEQRLMTGKSALLKSVLNNLLDNATDEDDLVQVKTDFADISDNLLKNIKDRIDLSPVTAMSKDIGLGVAGEIGIEAEVTEQDLIRSLEVVFNTNGFELPINFNGLGYNNLIYISVLLTHLIIKQDSKRTSKEKLIIFPLLAIEEPEAHLHPAMQYQLLKWLQEEIKKKKITRQIFITTHSSNITAAAGLDPLIMLYLVDNETKTAYPSKVFGDTPNDITSKRYIERFLDVTKSDMFFAKKILLVEGLAELLLMDTFAKYREPAFSLVSKHISVLQIGTNNTFHHFMKLFGAGVEEGKEQYAILKPVACITDKDPTKKRKPVVEDENDESDADVGDVEEDNTGVDESNSEDNTEGEEDDFYKKKCYPFEMGVNDSEYAYFPISAAADRIKGLETDTVKIFYNENKEGKTLEFDFAYHNPNQILLKILNENVTNKNKLGSLTNQFNDEPTAPIGEFLMRKRNGSEYMHKILSDDEEAALSSCSWELEEKKKAKIAASFLYFVENLKGMSAYKLAYVLKENLVAEDDDKIEINIPSYILNALNFLAD